MSRGTVRVAGRRPPRASELTIVRELPIEPFAVQIRAYYAQFGRLVDDSRQPVGPVVVEVRCPHGERLVTLREWVDYTRIGCRVRERADGATFHEGWITRAERSWEHGEIVINTSEMWTASLEATP